MAALPTAAAEAAEAAGGSGGGGRVALNYYRALAEQGSADAHLVLGDLYRAGEMVRPDLVEAYAWYYPAAQQGIEEAIEPMNEVLRALPESQWENAKKRAETYEREFPQPKGQTAT